MLQSRIYQPSGYVQPLSGVGDEYRITCLYRDAAVNNIRFFNIFYGFKPSVFANAANIFDRLLGKVKVSRSKIINTTQQNNYQAFFSLMILMLVSGELSVC